MFSCGQPEAVCKTGAVAVTAYLAFDIRPRDWIVFPLIHAANRFRGLEVMEVGISI
jgi:hypothetical protein